MTPVVWAWVLVLLAGVNSTIGNLFLKKSRLIAQDASFINSIFEPWFIGGLAFYGVNVILFAKALDHIQVSIAYPILAATGFTLLIVTSSFFFGESLKSLQYVGVVFILIGVGLLAQN